MVQQKTVPGKFLHARFRQGEAVIRVAQHGAHGCDCFQLGEHVLGAHVARVQDAADSGQRLVHGIWNGAVRIRN